jgi:hypothetical protein
VLFVLQTNRTSGTQFGGTRILRVEFHRRDGHATKKRSQASEKVRSSCAQFKRLSQEQTEPSVLEEKMCSLLDWVWLLKKGS